MSKEDIYQVATPIFRDVFDNDRLEIHEGTTAADVEGWDSLNNIRLMLSIQKKFAIKFSAAEIGRLKNVGELIKLIQTKTPQ